MLDSQNGQKRNNQLPALITNPEDIRLKKSASNNKDQRGHPLMNTNQKSGKAEIRQSVDFYAMLKSEGDSAKKRRDHQTKNIGQD